MPCYKSCLLLLPPCLGRHECVCRSVETPSCCSNRVFHHHIVEIMQQLIVAIKEKGPGADIDMSDVGQRESFDTIGEQALV